MTGFGASQTEIDAAIAADMARRRNEEFIILYDNWESYEIFARMYTQMRRNDWSGGVLGIDYTSLISVINLFNPDDAKNIFDRVRLIEHGYILEASKKQNG